MYTVYKVINKLNGKYYIGVHKTDDPHDNYMGSGPAIRAAIKKYGIEYFTKQVLCVHADADAAYQMEEDLLIERYKDEQCYNMKPGGKGGFDYINSNRDAFVNPMHNDYSKNKQVKRMKATKAANKQLYDSISTSNLEKAIAANTGRKRPDHSDLMKSKSHFNEWWLDKEQRRDQLSTTWKVTSPDGCVIITNRLEDFCFDNGLTYVSLWNTSRTGKPVKKGNSKGWFCEQY